MGDFLNENGIRAVWDPMWDLIKTEFPSHRKLYQYNQWWPRSIDEEINNTRKWISQRTGIFYQQIADYYHLGTPTTLTINKGMEELGNIQFTVNDIPLSEGVFDGKFFGGRTVRLNATSADGRQVTGWDITSVTSNGTTQKHVDGASYTFTMQTNGTMIIKAVIGTTDIHSIQKGNFQDTQYYSLDGKRLKQPQHGINIIRMTDGTTRKIVK